MKAAVLTGIRRMEVREVPDPKIEKDTDVLLKIEKVGVCGSDVHYFETGGSGPRWCSSRSSSGTSAPRRWRPWARPSSTSRWATRSLSSPPSRATSCDQCHQGRENTCFHLRFLGTPGQGDGCLSEFIVMPEECCFPIDGKITIEQGVLCEPLAIGVLLGQTGPAASRRPMWRSSDPGPIGLSCMVCARAEGVRACYMTEKIDRRMEMARKGGATWVGNPLKEDVVAAILKQQPLGMDVAFECAGQQETIDQAVDRAQARRQAHAGRDSAGGSGLLRDRQDPPQGDHDRQHPAAERLHGQDHRPGGVAEGPGRTSW